MRKKKMEKGEHYHIYNRGNNKQLIFIDERDWIRLLFSIVYLQSPISFNNIGRQVSCFVKNGIFNVSAEEQADIEKHKSVELINFVLMPNHFHLTVRELKEGGIAEYMQRASCGHTKYFNIRYNKSGHLFQGPYKAVHIGNNDQLLYLSTYIHRNPKELGEWKNKLEIYPWSSLRDYIGKNRWGALLQKNVIINQFKSVNEYKKFVSTSTAKKLKSELDSDLFLD